MSYGPVQYRSVAYFVNWAIYGRNHHPQQLPVENLTHVLYAFANLKESGELVLTDENADVQKHYEGDDWNDKGTNIYGCLKQLNLLKRRNRNLKILLSVGGWSYRYSFSTPASTDDGRKAFANSCVNMIKDYGFDGIDIDWEYPTNQAEATHFLTLLQTVRSALDVYASTLPEPYHFELTIACSANRDMYQLLNMPAMDAVLDFWNLMAYDYAGSWSKDGVGHHANLYHNNKDPVSTEFNTEDAVAGYVAGGVREDKIVLGMPLYGRGFANTDGPGKPYSGLPEGTWEAGAFDYKKLPLEGAEEVHDAEIGAAYCYHPAARTFVSYDSVPVARQKAEYIKSRGLGGAMWWESSADKQGGPESLIWNVVDVLGGPDALSKTPNCLEYPYSKYDNLRAGFPNN